MNHRIMYVCTLCADENPEGCGHYDRLALAVMPNGDWLCEQCWDEVPPGSKRTDENDERGFSDFPHPAEYVQP